MQQNCYYTALGKEVGSACKKALEGATASVDNFDLDNAIIQKIIVTTQMMPLKTKPESVKEF